MLVFHCLPAPCSCPVLMPVLSLCVSGIVFQHIASSKDLTPSQQGRIHSLNSLLAGRRYQNRNCYRPTDLWTDGRTNGRTSSLTMLTMFFVSKKIMQSLSFNTSYLTLPLFLLFHVYFLLPLSLFLVLFVLLLLVLALLFCCGFRLRWATKRSTFLKTSVSTSRQNSPIPHTRQKYPPGPPSSVRTII